MWSAAKRLVAVQSSWHPGLPPPRRPEDRFFVYEAWNATLREMLIGLSDGDIDAVFALHQHAPPASVAHWRADHKVQYKVIEENIPQDDAALFARLYGENCASRDVRVFLEA